VNLSKVVLKPSEVVLKREVNEVLDILAELVLVFAVPVKDPEAPSPSMIDVLRPLPLSMFHQKCSKRDEQV
jgi:hypothetical protein